MIGAAAILLSLIAEGSAAYALTKLTTEPFDEGEQQVANIAIFAVVSVAGFSVPRLLDVVGFSYGRGTAISLVATFLFVYGGLRIEFAGDIAVWDLSWLVAFVGDSSDIGRTAMAETLSGLTLLGMWSRSWWRSRKEVETDLLPRDAALPFGVLTVALVIAAPSENASAVAGGVLVFYAAALLSLACSQLARSGKTMGTIKSGDIVLMLLGATVVATLLGVLVFGLLFGLAVELLEPVVNGPIAATAEFTFVVILTPIAWVVSLLFNLMQMLLGDPQPTVPQVPEGAAPPIVEESTGEEPAEFSWARLLGFVARASVVLAGVVLLTLVVALLVKLRRSSRSKLRDAASESSSAGSLGDDLRGAWNALFQRGTRPQRTETGAVRLYLDLLDAAEDGGVERPVAATPAEFQCALYERFQSDATIEITALFQQARYAGREPDTRDVDSLRERWQRSGD